MTTTDLDSMDPVVALFAALAHPIRASIVYRLTSGDASGIELQDALGISQPLLSHHLKTLRDADLVQGRRDGRATVYTLTDTHVAHIFLDAYRHTSEHADD